MRFARTLSLYAVSNFHVVQWMLANTSNVRFVVDFPADLESIKWAHKNQYEIRNVTGILDTAVRQVDLGVLQSPGKMFGQSA